VLITQYETIKAISEIKTFSTSGQIVQAFQKGGLHHSSTFFSNGFLRSRKKRKHLREEYFVGAMPIPARMI